MYGVGGRFCGDECCSVGGRGRGSGGMARRWREAGKGMMRKGTMGTRVRVGKGQEMARTWVRPAGRWGSSAGVRAPA